MGLWLWRVNIPSTHWCFFLADLDGASQVRDLLEYKERFAQPKTLFIRRQQVPYLRCKTRERHKRSWTSRARHGPRMDIKFKNFILQKGSPVNQGQLRGSCFPQSPSAALPACPRQPVTPPSQSISGQRTQWTFVSRFSQHSVINGEYWLISPFLLFIYSAQYFRIIILYHYLIYYGQVLETVWDLEVNSASRCQ